MKCSNKSHLQFRGRHNLRDRGVDVDREVLRPNYLNGMVRHTLRNKSRPGAKIKFYNLFEIFLHFFLDVKDVH